MRFDQTELPGAWIIAPEPAEDARGSFSRVYCKREFAEHQLDLPFVQHSRSCSKQRGTLRGLHFQRPPFTEAKVVSCRTGAILDVIVDLRLDSPRFKQWRAFELTPENRLQLYVPPGFAHGFQTLRDDTEVEYLISEYYSPSHAAGLRYNDPQFGFEWPLPVAAISDKDRDWPNFQDTPF